MGRWGVFQESVVPGGMLMVVEWFFVESGFLFFFVGEFFDVFGLELSQTPKIARIAPKTAKNKRELSKLLGDFFAFKIRPS